MHWQGVIQLLLACVPQQACPRCSVSHLGSDGRRRGASGSRDGRRGSSGSPAVRGAQCIALGARDAQPQLQQLRLLPHLRQRRVQLVHLGMRMSRLQGVCWLQSTSACTRTSTTATPSSCT